MYFDFQNLDFEELYEEKPFFLLRIVIYILMVIIGFSLYSHFKNETQKYRAMKALIQLQKRNYTEFQYNELTNYIANNESVIKYLIGESYDNLITLLNNNKFEEIQKFLQPFTDSFPDEVLINDRISENENNQNVWILGAAGVFLFIVAFYFIFTSV